jgi:hypothetical protein
LRGGNLKLRRVRRELHEVPELHGLHGHRIFEIRERKAQTEILEDEKRLLEFEMLRLQAEMVEWSFQVDPRVWIVALSCRRELLCDSR